MDIRTKLIFALVAVSLASMLVFGAVMLPEVETRLRNATLGELDELAEAKREALGWIVEGWRDRVGLISSRTQLRASLAEYVDTGSEPARARIETILEDALASAESLRLLRVVTPTGSVVATVTRDGSDEIPSTSIARVLVRDRITYAGVRFEELDVPQVSFTAPLALEQERVGTLIVVFDAMEIMELTGHSHDLGTTGELVLVGLDGSGTPRALHPTRDGAGAGTGRMLPTGPEGLAGLALAGNQGPFWEDVRDYRGQAVWAATRLVPETGWGLIVKVDETEQLRPFEEFEESARRTALILSAFAILAGFVLGLRFALPIHHLAGVANRIRTGHLDARAVVTGQDEVAVLARTFNEMAGELEDQMSQLYQFQRFFDVSLDLMCMAGTDGYFKRVNPAFERRLGWTEAELLERPFLEFVHADDVDKTQREIVRLSEGKPTIHFENRYLCKDGEYRVLRWTCFPDAETSLLYAIAYLPGDDEVERGPPRGDGQPEPRSAP